MVSKTQWQVLGSPGKQNKSQRNSSKTDCKVTGAKQSHERAIWLWQAAEEVVLATLGLSSDPSAVL